MKICRQCGIEKPFGEYYVHPQMADGHLNKCKGCVKIRITKHRGENVDKIRKYDRLRGRTDERKERVSRDRYKYKDKKYEYNRKHREKYPEKYTARNRLHAAVRDGRLEKQPCESCGNEKVHAHHDDYSKPLNVRWLCAVCHGIEHRIYK